MLIRSRLVVPALLIPILLVLPTGCGATSPSLQHRDSVTRTLGGIQCVIQVEDDECWCIIRAADGAELTAVAYDADTGRERYDSQRFFGRTKAELLDLEDRGDARQVGTLDAYVASCLWVTGVPDFQGTEQDLEVVNRQSQLLSSLVGALAPPEDRADNDVFMHVWTSDGCTNAPDFNFVHCCYAHDACYARGGAADDREDCDVELCECITDAGYPVLGEVYYAAVRAFGRSAFGAR